MRALPAATEAEIDDLRERTQYEAWLLDEVYELSGEFSRSPGPSKLVYPAGGEPASMAIEGAGYIVLAPGVHSRWGPAHLRDHLQAARYAD